MQKGNLVQQGYVSDLLRPSEQVTIRLESEEETLTARAILEQAREQGATWISRTTIERDRQNQLTLLVAAPITHSSEVNALLARRDIFAAEIRPREGSLEEVFLQLTTPTAQPGQPAGSRVGMAALAPSPVTIMTPDTQQVSQAGSNASERLKAHE
jgi:ABC-2 type transport system ATP-binding protein